MRFISRSEFAALVAVFVMSAVGMASTSAFAASTNNPQWEVNKKVLGEGESKEVIATQRGTQTLSGPYGETFDCGELKVQTGAKIVGSKAPAPGSGKETIVYEECRVIGHPECKINGKAGNAKITTASLTSTLVFQTKEAAEKEASSTLTLLKPSTGKTFASYELSGPCLFTGVVRLEQELAVENIESAIEREVHELRGPGTVIRKYWVNEGGKTVEKKLSRNFPAVYSGTARFTLTTKELFKILN